MVGIKPIYWMRLSIPVLVSLAAGHMLFSRILSRVGIFIPKSGIGQEVFNWLVKTGNAAGSLLTVLAIALVFLLAFGFWWSKDGKLVLSLSVFLLPAMLLWVALDDGQLNNYQFISLTGVTLVITAQLWAKADKSSGDWRDSLWLTVLAGVVSMSLTAGLLTALAQDLDSAALVSFGTFINNAGQLLLVFSGFIIFGAYSVKSRVSGTAPILYQAGMACLLAAVFLGAYYLDRYTMATLLQWSVGLYLVLPVWVYAASLGCFFMGVSSLADRGKPGRSRAWGTLLVVLAGYQMPFTSDLFLVTLGLALLAFPGPAGAEHKR